MTKEKITKTRKQSITSKLLITYLVLSVIVTVSIGFLAYSYVSDYLINSTKETVEELASIVADNIDGDQHSAFTMDSITSDEYIMDQKLITSFLNVDELVYTYTMAPIDSNTLHFVLSSDDYLNDGCSFELTYDVNAKIQEALDGKVSSDDEFSEDEWGQYISAYAPIRNSANEVVGVVGIDYSANAITTTLHFLLLCIVAATFLLALLLVGTSSFFAYQLSNSFKTIISKVTMLSDTDGDLTQTIDITTGDELELVANGFNRFIHKIKMTIQSVNQTMVQVLGFSTESTKHFNETSTQVTSINDSMQTLCATMEEIQTSMDDMNQTASQVMGFLSSVCEKASAEADRCTSVTVAAKQLQENAVATKTNTHKLIEEYREGLTNQIEKANAIYEINQLTEDIISISSQTNLLSLNASIEAARAGEHGRGFAIVANEIGSLADTSSQTAEQIAKVNGIILDAFDGFKTLSMSLIDYLNTDVIRDYDSVVSSTEQYSMDANTFKTIMTDFADNAMQIEKLFSSVTISLQAILDSVAANNKEIEGVTQITDQLDRNVHAMNEKMEQNHQIIKELETTLSFFNV